MTPKEILEKAKSLSNRAHDMRRYEYDRDAAAKELIDLSPEVLAVFADILLEHEQLKIVADEAQTLCNEMHLRAPVAAEKWIERLVPYKRLRASLARWQQIQTPRWQLLEACRKLDSEWEAEADKYMDELSRILEEQDANNGG